MASLPECPVRVKSWVSYIIWVCRGSELGTYLWSWKHNSLWVFNKHSEIKTFTPFLIVNHSLLRQIVSIKWVNCWSDSNALFHNSYRGELLFIDNNDPFKVPIKGTKSFLVLLGVYAPFDAWDWIRLIFRCDRIGLN